MKIRFVHDDLAMAFGRMLGCPEVSRFSNVEWDGDTQEWVAVRFDGIEVARHPDRDACLAIEKAAAQDYIDGRNV